MPATEVKLKPKSSATQTSFSTPDSLELNYQNLIDNNNDYDTSEHGWGVGRQIWVRLRPPTRVDDNVIEVGEDRKTLKVSMDTSEHKLLEPMFKDHTINVNDADQEKSLTFKVDGILHESSQGETYSIAVDDVIVKAMDGKSASVILIGPEISGKSFTLFGYPKRYEHRGLLPRALEKMFEIVASSRDRINYRIQMAIAEIRQNRVKDLLTMGIMEIYRIGKDGPQGLLYKEISSMEEGLTLLMVALSGQKEIPRESYAKYHTLVFVDIHGENTGEEERHRFHSRVTFTKIASIPTRAALDKSEQSENLIVDDCARPTTTSKKNPTHPNPNVNNWVHSNHPAYQRPKSCCEIKNGPIGESIQIRRDLFLLKQMLIRSNELQRMNRYYSKIKRTGMLMLTKRPDSTPSQYFTQCKLAHCLQDIVNGTSEIRLILTIRPEKFYLRPTLEALRFAETIKCLPTDPCFIPRSRYSPRKSSLADEIRKSRTTSNGVIMEDAADAQVNQDEPQRTSLTEFTNPENAWKEFIHTPDGETIIAQIKSQNSAHDMCDQEINGVLEPVCQVVTECLHKISSLLLPTNANANSNVNANASPKQVLSDPAIANIDIAQNGQKRKSSAHNSETNMAHTTEVGLESTAAAEDGGSETMVELGVLDSNCDEFFEKMIQLCRDALEQHEHIILQSKAECERLFTEFCQGNPVGDVEEFIRTTTTQADSQTRISDTSSHGRISDTDENPDLHCPSEGAVVQNVEAQNYEEISRNAKRIAKQLIKCYSQRPPWISNT